MRVRVTKDFLWAPDGNNVITVRAGEVREDRGAVVAMQMGCGEEVQAAKPAPEPEPKPEAAPARFGRKGR